MGFWSSYIFNPICKIRILYMLFKKSDFFLQRKKSRVEWVKDVISTKRKDAIINYRRKSVKKTNSYKSYKELFPMCAKYRPDTPASRENRHTQCASNRIAKLSKQCFPVLVGLLKHIEFIIRLLKKAKGSFYHN